MTDVVDMLEPSQDAAYAVLKAGIDPAMMQVFVVPPQDTLPNFLKFGAIDSEPDPTIAEQIEKVTLELQYIYRGQDKGALLQMMHAGRALIDRKKLPPTGGATFGIVKCISDSVSDAAADGVTFAGIQNYVFMAQPAG